MMVSSHTRNSDNEHTSLTRAPEDDEQIEEAENGKVFPCDRLPHAGLIYAVTSGFTFSLCSVMVKLLHDLDPILVSFWAVIGVLLPSILLMVILREHPYPAGHRFFITARSITGAVNLIANFYAYRLLPLGDASVILFSTPVFVPILGCIFLKEDCGIFQIAVIILAIIGVNCVARPTFLFGSHDHSLSSLGLISAFVGVTSKSIAYVLVRQLKEVHHSVLSFHYSLVTLISSLAICLVMGTFKAPQDSRGILLCLGLMVAQYLTQTLIVKSLELESAGAVSIGRLSDIVFAFVWQYTIFHVAPYFVSIIGAVLVTLSIVMLGIRKSVQENSENKYLKCVFCL